MKTRALFAQQLGSILSQKKDIVFIDETSFNAYVGLFWRKIVDRYFIVIDGCLRTMHGNTSQRVFNSRSA